MIGAWWAAGAKKLAGAAPGPTNWVGSIGKTTHPPSGMSSIGELGARRMMTGAALGTGALFMRRGRRGSSGVEGVQPHSMGGTTMGGPGAGMNRGMY